jgi:hypothetical protein
MILKFIAQNHKYESIVEDDIDWLSVTTFISNFKTPFDADLQAEKSSKNKKSKWYGMKPDEIKEAWKQEANRATTLGTWYHNQRESDLCSLETMNRHGIEIPVKKPIEKQGEKFSPNQKLFDGIYPEHLVYLKSSGLCGQSDLVEVVDGHVHITDYKTNKEIKTSSYVNWEGKSQKMQVPISHLDDCNYIHYALQLSIYMYIILKHNPKLKPGSLTLHHIIFDEVAKNKHGNPITRLDENGDPVVKEVIPYNLPYLKAEIVTLIDWLKDNRHKVKPHH